MQSIFCHCFDASCLEICYFVMQYVLKLQDFQASGIKYSSRCSILSLSWCQLLGNLLLCNKTKMKFQNFPATGINCLEICYFKIKKWNYNNSKQLASNQVPHDATFCHCFDASYLEICCFAITYALKLQDFQATGIK